ncbi:MAG TPA: rhomboid family intramembrane serine protease, partial [Polyangiaceae bacterium]|nr:rhomboid family intramembrane serine protease [Polyangiaceae bacterium]
MSEDAGLDDAPVTLALLALNVAIFFVEVAGSPGRGVMGPFDSAQLLRLGAIYPLATIGENRWETLITSCFLHGGLVHLGVNMVALWWAGPIFERAVGPARMATMYLTAGAFGGSLSVA